MKRRSIRPLAWALVAVGLIGITPADDDSVEIDTWKADAEKGSLVAQSYLGVLYHQGKGVPKSYDEALKWFRKAAAQGDAVSQAMLGTMYFLGEGVPKDGVISYMWLNLASAKNPSYAKSRDEVAKTLTSEQVAQAQLMSQRMSDQYKPTSPRK